MRLYIHVYVTHVSNVCLIRRLSLASLEKANNHVGKVHIARN